MKVENLSYFWRRKLLCSHFIFRKMWLSIWQKWCLEFSKLISRSMRTEKIHFLMENQKLILYKDLKNWERAKNFNKSKNSRFITKQKSCQQNADLRGIINLSKIKQRSDISSISRPKSNASVHWPSYRTGEWRII